MPSDVPLELTEAEREFDDIVRRQRAKGRRTYAKGLAWVDGKDGRPYDWRQMALEEALDLGQYLTAEILVLRNKIRDLTSGELTFAEYQHDALRTTPADESRNSALAIRSLGLAGEVGEVVELVKKHLGHGHDLPLEKVEKELGDVLWYVATLAAACDIPLDRIAQNNIDKLRARYPAGFSHEASRNRTG